MMAVPSHSIGRWRRAVELFWLLFFVVSVLGFAFFLESRIARIERKERSRQDHPAGSYCPSCNFRVEDWDVHARLAHRKRVASPDDSW